MILCGLGVAVLLRADNVALSMPLLLLANYFAWPPRPLHESQPVRDLLDSTAEVKPSHVLLAFAGLAILVLGLSFSGPFWSWLTDRISYAPAHPQPMPFFARLPLLALWLTCLALGLLRTYRTPPRPRTPAA